MKDSLPTLRTSPSSSRGYLMYNTSLGYSWGFVRQSLIFTIQRQSDTLLSQPDQCRTSYPKGTTLDIIFSLQLTEKSPRPPRTLFVLLLNRALVFVIVFHCYVFIGFNIVKQVQRNEAFSCVLTITTVCAKLNEMNHVHILHDKSHS